MNFKKLTLGLGFAVALAAGGAQGALLTFQDDDIDYVLDGTTLQPKTSGSIQTGDIFVSIFEIPTYTVDGVNAIPAGQELVGVAAIQVTVDGTNLTFTAVDTGLNSILALGAQGVSVIGGDAGGGATVAMFFNEGDQTNTLGTNNLVLDNAALGSNGQVGGTNCTSLSDCIMEATLGATGGTLFQVDGFAGDPDEFWRSQVSSALFIADLNLLLQGNNSTTIASFQAAQTNFYQLGFDIGYIDIFTGAPCADGTAGSDTGATHLQGCVAGPTISGTIQGGAGLTNGAVAHSDFDAKKVTVVPEPGVLLLLSTALIGLAGIRRRG